LAHDAKYIAQTFRSRQCLLPKLFDLVATGCRTVYFGARGDASNIGTWVDWVRFSAFCLPKQSCWPSGNGTSTRRFIGREPCVHESRNIQRIVLCLE